MSTISPDDICIECGHRRGDHDGAGCNAQLGDGSPCPCRICVNMPSSEPTVFPDIKVTKESEDIMDRIAKFHAHLDECAQCENHPFALCPVGAALLKYAALGNPVDLAVAELWKLARKPESQ